ncbi:hypothetical protein GcM1_012003, partial [Golovinomyces cichoracearum]
MSMRISTLVANEYKVLFWVDQHYHFGHKVTSELEGNHAQLKNYLNTSTGHLKYVVDKFRLYWNNQAVAYWQKCTAQKRITNSLYAGTPMFAQILDNVHDYPFKIVEDEIAKIPKDYANWKPPCICTCSARTSFGSHMYTLFRTVRYLENHFICSTFMSIGGLSGLLRA